MPTQANVTEHQCSLAEKEMRGDRRKRRLEEERALDMENICIYCLYSRLIVCCGLMGNCMEAKDASVID